MFGSLVMTLAGEALLGYCQLARDLSVMGFCLCRLTVLNCVCVWVVVGVREVGGGGGGERKRERDRDREICIY